MATFLSSSSPLATIQYNGPKITSTNSPSNTLRTIASATPFSLFGVPMIGGLRVVPKIKITKAARRSSPDLRSCLKTRISCSIRHANCVCRLNRRRCVEGIIAKQLSIDESTVTPHTKFADLGADSIDTVEIMMALEEKFEVSIGEGGAENISTVQDAADLIEKVKVAAA
ncbi:hypothetical protein I3842_14G120200 [Carya illinoinensis]|uniref:Acyl carrier protein n=1 Tax=Carya illinoinensis TaxID=32201 RepID=A0A922D9L2_CARIL|nr:hypothetical protein I3842_14G120200 [Carya illinoinensis]